MPFFQLYSDSDSEYEPDVEEGKKQKWKYQDKQNQWPEGTSELLEKLSKHSLTMSRCCCYGASSACFSSSVGGFTFFVAGQSDISVGLIAGAIAFAFSLVISSITANQIIQHKTDREDSGTELAQLIKGGPKEEEIKKIMSKYLYPDEMGKIFGLTQSDQEERELEIVIRSPMRKA